VTKVGKPRKKQKLAAGKEALTYQTATKVDPSHYTSSLRSSKGVKKARLHFKPYMKGLVAPHSLVTWKPYKFIELALCLHAHLHYSKDLTHTRCKTGGLV
jgi:hypothetical protein